MATIKDIVLIYLENTPVSFARIESILPDHKKDWFQIKLLMLQIPLQTVVWILKDEYINGSEFSMNQKKMRLEKVVCPADENGFNLASGSGGTPAKDALDETEQVSQKEKDSTRPKSPSGQVISFSDLKNNKK